MRVRIGAALLLTAALLVGAGTQQAQASSPRLSAPHAVGARAFPPDPSANIPMSPSTLTGSCYAATPAGTCEAKALQALDGARTKVGLSAYVVPAGFLAMPATDQLLVLSNDDRTAYSLARLQGLNPTLSASAYAAARQDADPSFVDTVDRQSLEAGGSNWAGNYPDPLSAYYAWMYDDGPGSGNLDCTSTDTSGCWGHRHDTLFDAGSGIPVMGASAAKDTHGQNSFTELYESVNPSGVPTYVTPTTAAVGPTPPATAPAHAVSSTYAPTAFSTVTPTRICDTRSNATATSCAGGRVAAGGTKIVKVAGVGPVPATATTATVTVTITGTTAAGYATVWPADKTRPVASSVDWIAGHTVPDLAQVPLSSTGTIAVYVSAGTADVIVDVSGYGAPSSTGLFDPLTPARICDTRSGCGGAVGASAPRVVAVAGKGGVPSDATAVVLNLTVTTPSATAYLTAYPTGSSAPTVSNASWLQGQTVADRVVVPVGTGGDVTLAVSAGSAQVIVDVSGWYGSSGSLFTPIDPTRVCDTRAGQATNTCNGGAGQDQGTASGFRLVTPVQQAAGLPKDATAVVFTLTATGNSGAGYLAAYPDGKAWPGNSDNDFPGRTTVANLTFTALGSDGAIDVVDGSAATDTIVDVSGYYS